MHKGIIRNIQENIQIYKHKTLQIPEQVQINTKQDTVFKTLNIWNAQNKTKLYTTPIHNNTSVNNRRPTGSHSNNQPGHKYSTRLNTKHVSRMEKYILNEK